MGNAQARQTLTERAMTKSKQHDANFKKIVEQRRGDKLKRLNEWKAKRKADIAKKAKGVPLKKTSNVVRTSSTATTMVKPALPGIGTNPNIIKKPLKPVPQQPLPNIHDLHGTRVISSGEASPTALSKYQRIGKYSFPRNYYWMGPGKNKWNRKANTAEICAQECDSRDNCTGFRFVGSFKNTRCNLTNMNPERLLVYDHSKAEAYMRGGMNYTVEDVGNYTADIGAYP